VIGGAQPNPEEPKGLRGLAAHKTKRELITPKLLNYMQGGGDERESRKRSVVPGGGGVTWGVTGKSVGATRQVLERAWKPGESPDWDPYRPKY